MKKALKTIGAILVGAFGVYEFYDNWFETPDYGDSIVVDGTEIFYQQASLEDAQQLGDYLIESEFADGAEKSVQLTKEGDTFQFKVVYLEDYFQDSSLWASSRDFAQQLSLYVFNSSVVEFHVANDEFETQHVERFDLSDYNYGWEFQYGNVQLFFTRNVDYREAQRLGEYLEAIEFSEHPVSIQLDQSDSAYHFKQVTLEEFWFDEEYGVLLQEFAQELSDSLFTDAKVVFHTCDDEFESKGTYASQ